ncbi:hypothetical protein V4F39_03720 [Aquincola sp. MAHUQ-54]|uniref:DUF3108 domain-containing protein n=1 Tax=Aquincola agrisoli TaxID=3119538 RepID=A0AAW9QCK9_9BURK
MPRPNPPDRRGADAGRRRLLALAALAAAAPLARGQASAAYSPAEQALFVRPHLSGLRPGQALGYHFRHGGSMEPGFEDQVTIRLGPAADGRCCSARGEFLTGARALMLPDLPSATSNPVILYFLERDVREMQRLTRGQQNHFRKRIRVALADHAQVRELALRYRGQAVGGSEITVSPYLDDPHRARFERLAGKRYRFVLSEAVPGGVAAMSTTVADAAAGTPLIEDTLTLEGAEPPPPA